MRHWPRLVLELLDLHCPPFPLLQSWEPECVCACVGARVYFCWFIFFSVAAPLLIMASDGMDERSPLLPAPNSGSVTPTAPPYLQEGSSPRGRSLGSRAAESFSRRSVPPVSPSARSYIHHAAWWDRPQAAKSKAMAKARALGESVNKKTQAWNVGDLYRVVLVLVLAPVQLSLLVHGLHCICMTIV